MIEIPIVLCKLARGPAIVAGLLQSRHCILDILCQAFMTEGERKLRMKWYPFVRSRRCGWLWGACRYVPSLTREGEIGFCAIVTRKVPRCCHQPCNSLLLPLKVQMVGVDVCLALLNVRGLDHAILDDFTEHAGRHRSHRPLLHSVRMRIGVPFHRVDLCHERLIGDHHFALLFVPGLEVAHGEVAPHVAIKASLVLVFVPLDRTPGARLLSPLVHLGQMASLHVASVDLHSNIDIVNKCFEGQIDIVLELLPLHITIVFRRQRDVAPKLHVFRIHLVIEMPAVISKLARGLATVGSLL